jgi:hypothetical protein
MNRVDDGQKHARQACAAYVADIGIRERLLSREARQEGHIWTSEPLNSSHDDSVVRFTSSVAS